MSLDVVPTASLDVWSRQQAALRHGLLHPSPPTHLRVYLTRRQVHVLFPRIAHRFPLEARSKDGKYRVDLSRRTECWPLPLTVET